MISIENLNRRYSPREGIPHTPEHAIRARIQNKMSKAILEGRERGSTVESIFHLLGVTPAMFYGEQVDPVLVQKIGIEVMTEYGFDPNQSHIEAMYKLTDGSTREHVEYPSTTVPSLNFRRITDYRYDKSAETEKPVEVSWHVHYQTP